LLGYFIENQPSGEGNIYWTNEDICSCKIEENICKGKKPTTTGVNFIIILRTAFAPVGPKSVKRY